MYRYALNRIGIVAFCGLLFASSLFASNHRQIALTINDIDSPSFRAHGISARLSGSDLSILDLQVEDLALFGKSFRHARLKCPHLNLEATRIDCQQGILELDQKLPVRFAYSSVDKHFDLEITPARSESWNLSGRLLDRGFDARLTVNNGQLSRLASWLPDSIPKVSAGIAQGLSNSTVVTPQFGSI